MAAKTLGIRFWAGLFILLAPVVIGCAAVPRPYTGPPSLGLSGRETLLAYLASRPAAIKLKHQVEMRFMNETRVVEGYCVLARPGGFWARASVPLGVTLFEVKGADDGSVEVTTPIAKVEEARAPLYLARDIRRIYVTDCDSSASAVPVRAGFRVSCALPPRAPPATAEDGIEPDDDAVLEILSPGGVILEKQFFRDGSITATIVYEAYRLVDATWVPARISLEGRSIDYGLTIHLVEADPNFDVTRIFTAPAR